MQLTIDNSLAAHAVQVQCIRCGEMRPLHLMCADIEGPSFVAYFCDPQCRPTSAADAHMVYELAGWEVGTLGRWVEVHR